MGHLNLEQQILGCWQVTSDLNILLENVIENDSFTKDNISNVVLGLSELYELKFDKCFRTFEEASKEYYRMRTEIADLKYQVKADAEKIAALEAQLAKPKTQKRVKKNA